MYAFAEVKFGLLGVQLGVDVDGNRIEKDGKKDE